MKLALLEEMMRCSLRRMKEGSKSLRNKMTAELKFKNHSYLNYPSQRPMARQIGILRC
jgi:hypothetical protein